MTQDKKMKFLSGLLYLLSFIFIDQFSKFLVEKFWPGALLKNQGLAFGIFQAPFSLYFSIAVLLIFILIAIFSKTKFSLAFILIFAGALSNLIDRIFKGAILDFIPLFNLSYFNLADVEIFTGLILYANQIFRHK